jgi:hypothetical protein
MSQAFPQPSRRQWIGAAGASLLGTLGASPARAAASYRHPAKAKSVILLYLQGGPPTQDMFDMKPHAPDGVGGEFKPISSSVPGLQVCELLPQTAKWMHRSALVRSVYHNGGCHKNLPMYTGHDVNLPDEEFRESDPPSMGSVCAFLERGEPTPLPTYAYLPCSLGWGEVRKKAGPHAGYLGRKYDPFCTECTAFVDRPPDEIWKPQTLRGEPRLADTVLQEGLSIERLHQRRDLLGQFDERLSPQASGNVAGYTSQRRLAFETLVSAEVREAFDLGREQDVLRDRYGRTLFGSSALLARRLVQRGVKFVNVSWDNFSKRFQVSQAAWDTHERNFPMLKETLLPNFDQAYSALIEDLNNTGLLETTLVVTMGEMGRTPKINGKGGRDHWTFCYSVLLAGAGLQGGAIYGASDQQAAFVQDKPVHIRDIIATIYHLLGIDPEMPIYDRAHRPTAVAHGGRAVREILT